MMAFDSLQDWLTWQESLHPLAIDLGLERAQSVFYRLNPHYQKPLTITVAGTNGKGSCVAYLESIYRAQGYRVGAYTSPHILRYNERIKINGQPVADELICHAFERIESVRNGTSLSYFEFGTLAALDIFSHAQLDIQLLEVGLGGRLDAVNIISADVALISSIGIDHVEWLGHTREAIGYEKAGIFRAHTPVIIGDTQPPQSLLNKAISIQADVQCIGVDFHYEKNASTWTWFSKETRINELPEPVLKGEHQYRNASSVISAVMALQKRLPVSDESIKDGLKQVQLLGRFQLIQSDVPILLDVGHNPEAVATLVDYLNTHFPHTSIYAVFAMMKDKDIASVLKMMKPVIKHWFIAPLSNPRTAPLEMMQELFNQQNVNNVSFEFNNFASAFYAAKEKVQTNDLLLVFGSFFLVSDCLFEFEKVSKCNGS